MTTKLCECGCGEPAPIAKYNRKKWGWVKGQPVRFIHNHHHRGKRNVNYNGGLCFDKSQKRWFIRCRDNSYAAFARAVLACRLKRNLLPGEVVHHIDGDSLNDDVRNLELMSSQSAHRKKHALYSDESLIQALKSLANKLGRVPTSGDVDNDPDTPTRETYRARLGGLVNARKLAEISEVTRL